MTGNMEWTALGAAALAAGALAASGAANAQPRGYYEYRADYVTTPEGVTVYAPRRHERSAIGAPIEVVRASRVVYARDLNLSRPWGARVLRGRIERAAREACDELDWRFPITDDAPGDCYDGAVRGAMRQVAYRLGYSPPGWWY